jgi:acetyl esterase/lipase
METLHNIINIGLDVISDYDSDPELNSLNWGFLHSTAIKVGKLWLRKAGKFPIETTQLLLSSCKAFPWPGLKIERTTIPGRFRDQAHEILKKYFEEKYGYYPLSPKYHRNSSEPLQIQWLTPTDRTTSDKQPTLYHIHGGAWIFGHTCTYNHIFRDLTELSNSNIMSIEYRLSPQFPILSQIEDVVAGYLYLTAPTSINGAGKKSSQLLVGGESSGGHLSTVLIHLLRNINFSSPAGSYLISPAIDLTFSQPSFLTNTKRDLLFDVTKLSRLDREGHHFYSNINDIIYGQPPPYALDRIKNDGSMFGPKEILLWPELSPLFDKNMNNLPPSIIITGERDSLRDVSLLYGKERALSEINSKIKHKTIPNIQTYIFEDMVHSFPCYPPNKYSKKALKTLGEFIYQALNSNNLEKLESRKFEYLIGYKKAYMESTYNMYWNNIENVYSPWNNTYEFAPYPTTDNFTKPGILPNLPESYTKSSYLKYL